MTIQIPNRYDVVGSFLRPESIIEARKKFIDGELSRNDLTAIEDNEITKLIRKQLSLGLKNISDGEFRRAWWHLDFFHGLQGISPIKIDNSGVNKETVDVDFTKSKENKAFVTGKISAVNHPFIEHYKFVHKTVNKFAHNKAVARITMPAPARFYYQLISTYEEYESCLKHYPNKDVLFTDIIDSYRQVIKDLYKSGCRNIQLDDTTWITLVDQDRFRKVFSFYEGDLNKLKHTLSDDYITLNNSVLINQPSDIVFTTHTCRGNFRSRWASSGAYDDISEKFFKQQHFQGYFLEYDSERAGGFEPLANMPNDRTVVLGLVTSKFPELEDEELIIEKIEAASQYHPLEKLCLSPQCGFASTEEGNELTEEDQWRKVKLVKEIAQIVWKDA